MPRLLKFSGKLAFMEAVGGPIERRLIRQAAQGLAALGLLPPAARLLCNARRRAAQRALDRRREGARSLAPALARGEQPARDALAELAESALAEMRQSADDEAGRSGLRRGFAASLDAWWRDTDEGEYLDDPDIDQTM